MAECIWRSPRETLGISRRGGSKMKEVWWWSEDIKENVKEKKEVYTTFINSGMNKENEISRVRYNSAKKVAKKDGVGATSRAYDRL